MAFKPNFQRRASPPQGANDDALELFLEDIAIKDRLMNAMSAARALDMMSAWDAHDIQYRRATRREFDDVFGEPHARSPAAAISWR